MKSDQISTYTARFTPTAGSNVALALAFGIASFLLLILPAEAQMSETIDEPKIHLPEEGPPFGAITN